MPVSQLALKQTFRKTIFAQRDQLPADARAARSASIIERLMQMPEYRRAETVLGYMNFGAEFESSLWVERVLAEGKRLALPKVNRHTNRLDLYWLGDLENQLAVGSWGIREPVVERCERLNGPNDVEFVLLPGVAFARDGARLGYGGGFYDKLLADLPSDRTQRPVLVAAAFALQIVEFIPQEPTDVRVEWIVTEQETIACSSMK
jgi:5-formyltetrahydrofolate cyclo-ligase